eukprot:2669755-Rhodomonas_salina.1
MARTGSGKSTVAQRLLSKLTEEGVKSVVVPMDGYLAPLITDPFASAIRVEKVPLLPERARPDAEPYGELRYAPRRLLRDPRHWYCRNIPPVKSIAKTRGPGTLCTEKAFDFGGSFSTREEALTGPSTPPNSSTTLHVLHSPHNNS